MNNVEACPACKSPRVALSYIGRTMRKPEDLTNWHVWNCSDCGHGFINPQPSWDELQAYYDDAYDPYEDSHGVQAFDAEVAQARRTGKLRHVEIKPGIRLLDVGCGGGVFLRMARELGAVVQGVEPSPHGAATTAKAGIPVFNGMLDDFIGANPDAQFDLITSNHVVEHHSKPADLLAQMKSLLAPGGKIWFSVPNAGCDPARRLNWRWHSADLPYHLMQFSPQSVRKVVAEAGLTVSNMETETLPHVVRHSILHMWRREWKVPVRLSQHLPIMSIARQRAKAMDSDCAGEAILTEVIPV